MRRTLVLVGALLMGVLPALPAGAASEDPAPPPPTVIVDNSPDHQTSPSVAGSLVVYEAGFQQATDIRFRSLTPGGPSGTVPNPGFTDYLPALDGTRIAYSRLSTDASRIMIYDVATPATAPVPLHPTIWNGRAPQIGASTVVFQDLSYGLGAMASEIVVVDLVTSVLTRVTNDGVADITPAVSPDGGTIAWTKCQGGNVNCDIWVARRADGWQEQRISPTNTEESLPDLDNTTIVYASKPTDLAQQIKAVPIVGGTERVLATGTPLKNPNISKGMVSFEIYDDVNSNYEIAVWNLSNDTYRIITDTGVFEFLNDIAVGADGAVRVVWAAFHDDDGANIMATTIDAPGMAYTSIVAEPVVARVQPLAVYLTHLQARLTRNDTGAPISGATLVFRAGAKVLCTSVTNSNGVAICDGVVNGLTSLLNLGYTVSYAGLPQRYWPTTAAGGIIR